MAKPKKPAKKPAKAPAKKPAKAPAKKPAKAPAKKPAKPPAKTPAKKSAKQPAKQPPASAVLAALALAGDVEGLSAAIEPFLDEDGLADALLYKWLEVAAGHGTAKQRKAAEALQGDLLEVSVLRYDDDQMMTGEAHFELGVAYLTGGDGLPRDLTRAADQLAMAKQRYYPFSIQGGDKQLQAIAKALPSDARAAFEQVYDGTEPVPSEDENDDY